MRCDPPALKGAGDTIAKSGHQTAQRRWRIAARLVPGYQETIGPGIAKRACETDHAGATHKARGPRSTPLTISTG